MHISLCPAEILSIIRSTAENKVIHLHGMYDERDGIDNIIADYNPSLNSVHQYTQQPFIHPPHHTHPEERIWAGRTPRVPDAPRIKHDKMKQFYMVDMRRKRW